MAKKKKVSNSYKLYDLKSIEQFPLVDAMRYIRAFEVGRDPKSSKYEVHVRLRALKNGPAIRTRFRLPHPVKIEDRICVIAAPGSQAAADARDAGVTLVGEDDVFAQIKNGVIEFDRVICHLESLPKLNKSGVARVLGPKGLMPSVKTGNVVSNIKASLKDVYGSIEYRERRGVVRLAVGQLGYTPEELRDNMWAFMESLKKDISQMGDRTVKEIHEVVLSSTNAPGFTLNGDYRGPDSIAPKELSGPL